MSFWAETETGVVDISLLSAGFHEGFVIERLADVAHHGDRFHLSEYRRSVQVWQVDWIHVPGSMNHDCVIGILTTKEREMCQVVFYNVFDLELHCLSPMPCGCA